jgi:hypothetical protein
MSHVTRLALMLALPLSVAATSVPVFAQGTSDVPAYHPPLRGAPASRFGGGTRGLRQTELAVQVLAPDHTGLTSHAQPTLYWYASAPVGAPVKVTLLAKGASKPLLATTLPASTGAGVHAIDLARLGVTLRPNTEYEWFVAVVPEDPEQRSRAQVAGGTLRRIEADAATRASVKSAGDRGAPTAYAAAGLWYDAIDSISRLIERNPTDADLRAGRAALLDQANLTAVAAYDRGH